MTRTPRPPGLIGLLTPRVTLPAPAAGVGRPLLILGAALIAKRLLRRR